jgi:DMSO/TMAO reductase YedYZ heme-binding membrane subunit
MKRWLRALVISLIIFLLLSLYLYLRRGYYNIYIINKVFGSTAVVLAGVTLLIGPLRQIPFVASLMTVRRQLGLIAFGVALLHIFFSLFQSERFIWFSWYFREWTPIVFGILAIVTWGYMTYISRNTQIQKLGTDVWKKRLSLAGKIGFLAIFFHLTIMKYPGWIRWLHGEVKQTPELANPSFPPASIFVFLFMCIVIMYRIFTFLKGKNTVQEGK